MQTISRLDRARVACCLLLAGVVAVPVQARSQSLDGIALGTRIRVEMPNVERQAPGHDKVQSVAGTLDGVRGDTLSLLVGPGAASLRVSRESIRHLYVSRGRPPRWQSALRGAIAPALLGAAASAVSVGIRGKDDGQRFGRVVASSAAWGAASGAAFSAWSQRERWRRVANPTAPSPSSAVAGVRRTLPPNEN